MIHIKIVLIFVNSYYYAANKSILIFVEINYKKKIYILEEK